MRMDEMTTRFTGSRLKQQDCKRADMASPPADALTQERVMYYSASWQLLEERITDDLLVEARAEPEINRHMQYIWGNRYIDDIALRRENRNFGNDSPDVTYEVTWYHLTDALFSTVVITNHAGIVAERVSYTPYGKACHHRAADLTGDGAVNSADQLHLFNAWGDGFFADYNRDGSVDSADLLFLTTNWGAAESPGRLSVTDNTIGFAGYVFNAEFDDAGVYTVRYRPYEPELGRWLSRDPLGYVDGMGLYEYVRGRPRRHTDPRGLTSSGIYGDSDGPPWWVRGCAREADSLKNCKFCCYYHSDGYWNRFASQCSDDCESAFPPWMPPPPLPHTTEDECLNPWLIREPDKNSCYQYGLCDCLYDANVRCMCRCMGNDPWDNFVRGCLQCMMRVPGMAWDRAHLLCWFKGTEHFGVPSAPVWRLQECANACRTYQRAVCSGECEWPVLIPLCHSN